MRYILTLILGVVVETVTTVLVLIALLWGLAIWVSAGRAVEPDARSRLITVDVR